ncbi:hypothetical protein BDW59DRAFT_139881 [Aspergillus cavernicola]|uniref:Uncharacterized protein n=1 Tax=Aspergillus cavernicola TaxID=176166 RepID=A0ABR4IVC2_9EURO
MPPRSGSPSKDRILLNNLPSRISVEHRIFFKIRKVSVRFLLLCLISVVKTLSTCKCDVPLSAVPVRDHVINIDQTLYPPDDRNLPYCFWPVRGFLPFGLVPLTTTVGRLLHGPFPHQSPRLPTGIQAA